ncbi:hypothetical protein [Methanosarcina barkeri]|uniref:hypothetical protein n=1 Tax=Methanosarcina barkeri TaxID=2208 RepID=UPI00064E4B8A|nr:hypothetical protein [Methanosarcina barkeri]
MTLFARFVRSRGPSYPSSVTRVPSREDGALFATLKRAELPEFHHPSSITRVPSQEDGKLSDNFVR